jgi:uncharacterized membrane protein YfcA
MILGIPLQEIAALAAALIAAGAVTGVLAGLFGVGGGAVMVPVLYEVFRLLDVPEAVRMPLCVGTSLAIIIPTSVRSFQAHRAHGAVDMGILRVWAVPVLVGVLGGSMIARVAPPAVFKLAFVLVAGITATKLLFGRESWRLGADLPKGPLMHAYGAVIGVLSSLMGIGGGALSNLMMSLYNRPIHQSIATSSGVGVLVSVPGMLGYIYAGWPKMALLPPLSLGFVSLIGLVLMMPSTMLTTPYGVRLAHTMPKRRLELAFGLFLIIVAGRFVIQMV